MTNVVRMPRGHWGRMEWSTLMCFQSRLEGNPTLAFGHGASDEDDPYYAVYCVKDHTPIVHIGRECVLGLMRYHVDVFTLPEPEHKVFDTLMAALNHVAPAMSQEVRMA